MKLFTVLIAFFFMMFTACDHNSKGPDPCGDGEISAADAVWSHGGGDLQNTQRHRDLRLRQCFSLPQDTPRVEWSFPLGGHGTAAAPVVADDGTIYIIGEYPGEAKGNGVRNSGLLAIRPSGILKWFFPLPVNAVGGSFIYTQSPALAADGTVYIRGYDSTLKAISSDGTLKWTIPAITSVRSPVVDNSGYIYTGMDTIYCFNPDGTIRWAFRSPDVSNYCTRIVLSRTRIYCGFYESGILALNYRGEQVWHYPAVFANFLHYGILVDGNDNLYFKGNSDQIYSIDKNGTFRWGGQVSTPGGMSEPVLRGDYLYFGAFGGIYQLDKNTGSNPRVLNTVIDGNYISSDFGPLIDDFGTLLMAGGSNYVAAIKSTGDKLWEVKLEPNVLQGTFDGYAALGPDSAVYLATWESASPNVTNYLYKLK